MAARHRRRRRAAPRRRLRRWFRRQDRLTRGLLFAVVLLAGLIAVLMVPIRERGPERRAANPAATAKAPPQSARSLKSAPPSRAARPAVGGRREATAPTRSAQKAPAPLPAAAAGAATAVASPRAAIVIDDLGRSLSHLEQLAALGLPLTVAVIPGLPATAATVREAARRGIEVILHQPMEPREEGGKDAGAGVLLAAMSPEEIRGRLAESLAAVPGAVGVNNHMGSRFTEEEAGLQVLMAELGARGLFWLDSRTTAATRGAEAARAAGVPALERDVFIDAEAGEEFARRQARRLLALARKRGSAIGIGHPHPETIAALRGLRGELQDAGVTLVPLSALVPAAPGAGATLAAAKGGAGKPVSPATP